MSRTRFDTLADAATWVAFVGIITAPGIGFLAHGIYDAAAIFGIIGAGVGAAAFPIMLDAMRPVRADSELFR